MTGVKETPTGLNIKAVADRTGIPLHTLRAWERRYGIPRPARVPGNRYRVYDEQDIADVLWLKRQVEAGVSPAQASAMLQQQKRRTEPLAETAEQPIAATQAALLNSLLASDEITAQQIMDQAWALFSPEQVARQLIQPTMTEIGERWMRNEITVGEEHFASNLIRQRLLAVLQAQPPLPVSAPRLAAACPPAEQHELGLLLFALLARRSGWQVFYLGQRTPLADLVRWGEVTRLVVLTVATVNGLASLIPLWNDKLRPSATVVFGGLLFTQIPLLREHVPGAFLGEDTVEAVRTLATSNTGTNTWRPSTRSLNAAFELEENRLRLAEATLAGMKRGPAARTAARHSLADPTLFLVDAVASALAFDVPELMDAQGAWIHSLLPSHGVDLDMLEEHLKTFARAVHRTLPDEYGGLVDPLLDRLAEAGQ